MNISIKHSLCLLQKSYRGNQPSPILSMDGTEAHADVKVLHQRLAEHGQAHLLQFWDHLSETEQFRLSTELSALDAGYVNRCYEACIDDLKRPTSNFDHLLEPLPESVVGSVVRTDPEILKQYELEGWTFFCLSFVMSWY